jgi:hypothetical protein
MSNVPRALSTTVRPPSPLSQVRFIAHNHQAHPGAVPDHLPKLLCSPPRLLEAGAAHEVVHQHDPCA